MLNAVLEIGKHGPLVVFQRVVSASALTITPTLSICEHRSRPHACEDGCRSSRAVSVHGGGDRHGARRGATYSVRSCKLVASDLPPPSPSSSLHGNSSHLHTPPRTTSGTPHCRHATAQASGGSHILKRRVHPLVELSDLLLHVVHERCLRNRAP
jgi:hypothetical protein